MSNYILKTKAAEIMLGHFPVRKVSPLGLLGEFCMCGVRFGIGLTYPIHIVHLLEAESGPVEV
jgi:hypothetical protein